MIDLMTHPWNKLASMTAVISVWMKLFNIENSHAPNLQSVRIKA